MVELRSVSVGHLRNKVKLLGTAGRRPSVRYIGRGHAIPANQGRQSRYPPRLIQTSWSPSALLPASPAEALRA